MSFPALLGEAVLSARSDAIVAADGDGIIRFWNPGAERIFGYSRDEALGRYIRHSNLTRSSHRAVLGAQLGVNLSVVSRVIAISTGAVLDVILRLTGNV